MNKHFFIGTTNQGKIREIASILSATGFTYAPTDPIDPEETEPDFEGNALLKARAYAKHAGGMTISEDSGLIIPALGGLPGPWSARFADTDPLIDSVNGTGVIRGHRPSNLGREEMDRTNNDLVIAFMQGVEQPRRAASFKVVLCVASPTGEILFKAVGESFGWIAEAPKGSNGFGYDPIFIGQDTFGKTYAELDSARKNLRSHRHHVLQEFQAWLAAQLVSAPKTLHFKTQEGQPYGSSSRKCSECGVMLWGQLEEPEWTDDRAKWGSPPAGFVNCRTVRENS